MRGIYFINSRIKLKDLTEEQSFDLQQSVLTEFIKQQNIRTVTLDSDQVYPFYTIPHALLYDLRKHKQKLDCLLIFSQEVMEDFIYTYPAKWLILKSYFHKIIFVDSLCSQDTKQIS